MSRRLATQPIPQRNKWHTIMETAFYALLRGIIAALHNAASDSGSSISLEGGSTYTAGLLASMCTFRKRDFAYTIFLLATTTKV